VTAALELSDLTYRYPDGHDALNGCNLRIEQGERVALLGPNGAGKSTLILHTNGVLLPSAGTVRVNGALVARETLRDVRRQVGLVFQDPDDQLFMSTVFEDVAFGPRNLGLEPSEVELRVARALRAVGMEDHERRPPHHLSFGQRRRVAVATVLSMDPSILVLDEPTSNLDPASRRELATILDGLPLTILLATHDLPYALELCPRSLIMAEGRIVADGATQELLSDEELLRANRLELPYAFDPSAPATHRATTARPVK
jgi:cobalt/nickel transport system ATP-binding protein